MEQWILVENQTYEEIGRRLGVTGAAIKKAAKRLGIELPVRSVSLHTSTMSQLESGRMGRNGSIQAL